MMEILLYVIAWLWIGIVSAAVVCVLRYHPFRGQEAIFGAIFGPLTLPVCLSLWAVFKAAGRD